MTIKEKTELRLHDLQEKAWKEQEENKRVSLYTKLELEYYMELLQDLEVLEILKKDTHLCLYEFDLDDNWYDWYLETVGKPKITREEYLKVQKWLEGED